jgi:two-component system KDP operon response regulator KdpE
VRAANLEIDLMRRLVKKDDELITLTRTEWQLLQFLAEHEGKVLLNGEILSKVWGPEYRDDLQFLRVWISRLRSKIEPDRSEPRIIKTLQGVGYRFEADETQKGDPEVSLDELEATPSEETAKEELVATA